MVTQIYYSQNQPYSQSTGENLSASPSPKYLERHGVPISGQPGIRKPIRLILLSQSPSHIPYVMWLQLVGLIGHEEFKVHHPKLSIE
jgi:hypothetical protein